MITPSKIEAYCIQASFPEDKLLQRLAQETRKKTQYPQMMVGPLEGAFLRTLVQAFSAKRVLEIGTFTGYSALWMASGLPEDGKVITCDVNPKTTRIAQSYWKASPHGRKIELRLGPALETLQVLKGQFDFVFIDADKPNYIAYWDKVLPLVSKGGGIVADNVLWSGRVLKPKDATDQAILQFNRHVSKDSRVISVMLPVRDGMTLAIKK